MRITFNDHVAEIVFSMVELGIFVFVVYLITFFAILTAVIVSRGIV